MAADEAGGFRFPRTRRIRLRREFLEVQSGARRDGTRAGKGADSRPRSLRRRAGRFLVVMRRRPSGPVGRLGVTVPARIGCAVRRNRIRRLIREAYRTTADLFPEGHDVVVIVLDGNGEWNLAAVKEELARWR